MKFSKKSRYGLMALVDLAVHSEAGHVSLNCIAERNQISPQYLEQIFAALRRAGILRSIKGSQGGYLLNRPAREISVADVLLALDGGYRLEDERAGLSGETGAISGAIQTCIVEEVNRQLDHILRNLSLADLVREYEENQSNAEGMYYI